MSVVPSEISSREAEVWAAIGDRATNAEIAARLAISVRTVESHVSSLLRKLRVADRRALASLVPAPVGPVSGAGVPVPLTSFVGRAGERAVLAGALAESRLVTAVGPGGVGKTRLALEVAGDLRERFAGGTWYVDLVPVTDPALIAAAVAATVGVGERQGRSTLDTVMGWLAGRDALLILDNCEHLQDGVGPLVERLLAGCPYLRVLATSRSRLLLPFERVVTVAGLSVEPDGDAVALFRERAAAAGAAPAADGPDGERIVAICRGLDGSALAIELAAARLPALGLDGLTVALADRLDLLTGGSRAVARHRSLRSTLDWSYALLDPAERAVLRRVSVFAVPFTAVAAAEVVGGEPGVAVPDVLGRLAEQSLLLATAAGGTTRYRALETVRQYGQELLAEAAEAAETADRHRRWCRELATELAAAAMVTGDQTVIAALPSSAAGAWRAAYDAVVDEIRAALRNVADRPERRVEAYELAHLLARLSFARGFCGESQRRYEQAAALAGNGSARAAAALRDAAGAAETRHFGADSIRLYRAAAVAAVAAGDRPAAAWDLARAAESINRMTGLHSAQYSEVDALELRTQARAYAGDDRAALARLLAAEAFTHEPTEVGAQVHATRACRLARQAGDRLTESSALDQLTAVQLAAGQVRVALATASQRVRLLSTTPMTAGSAMEISDAHTMAAECALAAGDLPRARLFAEQIRGLPFHREETHLANARLIVVSVLTGDLAEAAVFAELFRDGWERSGRPRARNLSPAAYAAAALHGLRGEPAPRAEWLTIVETLGKPAGALGLLHYSGFFDALQWLHSGAADRAYAALVLPPEELRHWHSGLWLTWYTALWAEAAVLSGSPEAADRIVRARSRAAENPIAAALVERAAAIHSGDRAGVAAAAAALAAGGCRYQSARTSVLLGGADGARGAAVLAEMGTTPTEWAPAARAALAG